MRKKLKPIVVFVFFALFICMMLWTRQHAAQIKQEVLDKQTKPTLASTPTDEASADKTSDKASKTDSDDTEDNFELKAIIDVSGWQYPSEIDYDTLAKNVSGVIVRIQSGIQTPGDNAASDANGLDKAYKTHIEEFQKRGVPVAVYAYLTGSTEEEMKHEAQTFYKAASKYKPTYYWLDVEENFISHHVAIDLNIGIETFRAELASLGAENIGIYINSYFMADHAITAETIEKFDAVWVPDYGLDTGYIVSTPSIEVDYDLHQYTSRGYVNGYGGHLDMNVIASHKDPKATFQKLFTIQKDETEEKETKNQKSKKK